MPPQSIRRWLGARWYLQNAPARRRARLETGENGQAPGRTPARLEAGAGPLLNGQHPPAEGQAVAGTTAAKVTGKSSQPSTNWLTLTNTFVPTGGTPYRDVYRPVMSADPATGAGHMPRIRKSVNFP